LESPSQKYLDHEIIQFWTKCHFPHMERYFFHSKYFVDETKEAKIITLLKIPGIYFTGKSLTAYLKNGGFKFRYFIFQSN